VIERKRLTVTPREVVQFRRGRALA